MLDEVEAAQALINTAAHYTGANSATSLWVKEQLALGFTAREVSAALATKMKEPRDILSRPQVQI